MFQRIRFWHIIVLLIMLATAIYSNVILRGIFIFDDSEYVTDNTLVRGFTYSDLSDPRQIGYLSFALNYLPGGYEPQGYHILNVAIHVVNASLMYALLYHRRFAGPICHGAWYTLPTWKGNSAKAAL